MEHLGTRLLLGSGLTDSQDRFASLIESSEIVFGRSLKLSRARVCDCVGASAPASASIY